MVAFLVLAFALLLGSSQAFQHYQSSIPNGENVTHPCEGNSKWPGVGHENSSGGGKRNAFGLDFARLGHTWNEEICRADSDGDGWTNGYELGDPDCTWSPGQIPSRSDNITHPGVCDNGATCEAMESFANCSSRKFYCPRTEEAGVRHLNLTFPEITIPPSETNYFCMTFDLPDDQEYHAIGDEPIIDNANVLHHIVVYGCEPGLDNGIPVPIPCSMDSVVYRCNHIIGLWGFGHPGTCYRNDTGFRIGRSSFKRLLLEVHYNNPRKKSGLTDKSGMTLYYQPASTHVQDMVTFTVGARNFLIPPGYPRYEVSGVCNTSCNKVIKKPAKIAAAVNHMHYMGIEMQMELFRCGQKKAVITYESHYSYDNPQIQTHDPSIDLLPGDEIKTTCVYNSEGHNRSVSFGIATSDEMCYGFVFVYPAQAFPYPYCVSSEEAANCDEGTPDTDDGLASCPGLEEPECQKGQTCDTDAAPKMAAGWITFPVTAFLLVCFFFA